MIGPESFTGVVEKIAAKWGIALQPRMGFRSPRKMLAGLSAVREIEGTVGTITVDSFTRMGDPEGAHQAAVDGDELNGYPLTAETPETTAAMLERVQDEQFRVQVRHGTAKPLPIALVMRAAGISATEGGPISYCLPYGRTPLAESISNWTQATEVLLDSPRPVHLETFGGCLLGQLCPPSLLVATAILEAIFFERLGVEDLSLSYTQQTSAQQDIEALEALRGLATDFLKPTTRWHLVLYGYMGVYPTTDFGADLLADEAVALGLLGRADRLIVKTRSESRGIPDIDTNVTALRRSRSTATLYQNDLLDTNAFEGPTSEVSEEARAILETCLELHPDTGRALELAFAKGLLDVPFCLHPDNHGLTLATLDGSGRIVWANTGRMPISGPNSGVRLTANGLLRDLTYVRRNFDCRDPSLRRSPLNLAPSPHPASGYDSIAGDD